MPRLFHVCPGAIDQDRHWKIDIVDSLAARHGWQIDRLEYETGSKLVDVAALCGRMSASDLVIADLSFERPSCYFELGIAAALDRPILMLVDSAAKLHQHPPAAPILPFSNMAEYKRQLEVALQELALVSL